MHPTTNALFAAQANYARRVAKFEQARLDRVKHITLAGSDRAAEIAREVNMEICREQVAAAEAEFRAQVRSILQAHKREETAT